jgi:hypothetical protein
MGLEKSIDHVKRVVDYFSGIDLLNVKKKLNAIGFNEAAMSCDNPERLRFIIDSFSRPAVDYAFLPEIYEIIK